MSVFPSGAFSRRSYICLMHFAVEDLILRCGLLFLRPVLLLLLLIFTRSPLRT